MNKENISNNQPTSSYGALEDLKTGDLMQAIKDKDITLSLHVEVTQYSAWQKLWNLVFGAPSASLTKSILSRFDEEKILTEINRRMPYGVTIVRGSGSPRSFFTQLTDTVKWNLHGVALEFSSPVKMVDVLTLQAFKKSDRRYHLSTTQKRDVLNIIKKHPKATPSELLAKLIQKYPKITYQVVRRLKKSLDK